MTIAEMRESKQGLPPRTEAPTSGAETTTVFPQTIGKEAQGRLDTSSPGGWTGMRNLWWARVLLGRRPISQGLRPSVSRTDRPGPQIGKGSLPCKGRFRCLQRPDVQGRLKSLLFRGIVYAKVVAHDGPEVGQENPR